MNRVLRLMLITFVTIGVLVATVYTMKSLRTPSAEAATSAATSTVVMTPLGRNTFEFVGRIDQEGTEFTGYGYLTYVDGLDTSDLFTSTTPSEANARFTFTATASMSGRSVISNLFSIDAVGELTIYFDADGGATFADPSSFAQGDVVAEHSARFHNVITVIEPHTGLANGIGELRQTTVGEFELNGESYKFGRNGLQERMSFTGFGIRTEPSIPRAEIAVAGDSMSLFTGPQTSLPLIQSAP
jgi:hypothetical protein